MTATTARAPFAGPSLWVPGDWNAFFGFGTNILVNLLVLTGLLRFVLGMPEDIVFGRILPATGLMLCLSTVYCAWLAHRLARSTGRSDVLFALAGAVLTFFGLIHGEAIGFGSSPQVAAGYAIVAIILYACAKKAFIVPLGTVAHEEPAL